MILPLKSPRRVPERHLESNRARCPLWHPTTAPARLSLRQTDCGGETEHEAARVHHADRRRADTGRGSWAHRTSDRRPRCAPERHGA
jgi:hypothetical protein